MSISLEISTRIYLIKKTNRDKVVASDLTVILMTGLKSTLITSRLISIDQIGGFCTATTQQRRRLSMIPIAAAGSVGLRILKTLYKGKKWIGRGSKKAAEFAGKHHAGTSKFITGASQKTHKGVRLAQRKIKKHPKTSAAIGGAIGWDMLVSD